MAEIRWWLSLRRFLLISYALGAALLLCAYYPAHNIPPLAVVLSALGGTLISVGTVRGLFEAIAREDLASTFSILADQSETGIKRVVFPAQGFDWLTEIKATRSVTIFGLRLSFAENQYYLAEFERILTQGGTVRLIMSDPRSPSMLMRYLEEPHSHPWGTDPDGWNHGLENLSDLASKLWAWREFLRNEGKDVSRLSISLFPGYPAGAYYAFDGKFYTYSYPYKIRGHSGPLYLFSPDSKVGKFYGRCLQSVVDASIPIEFAIEEILDISRRGGFADSNCLSRKPAVLVGEMFTRPRQGDPASHRQASLRVARTTAGHQRARK
ncbi:hypothetical protein ABZ379_18305 [Streptomyces canus]|uniref:hypothetical protein n=1 Tax=Streptomyces canus TaxID=58343 RepID=UPI0033F1BDD0